MAYICIMPLLEHTVLDNKTEIGVWKLEEDSDFFLSQIELSATEKEYFKTLKGKRPLEYLCSRFLLHKMTGRDVRAVCVKDDAGKPFLKDSKYSISFSHSHELVAVIASPKVVGIDIQKIVPKIERIANKFLNVHELDGIPPGNRIQELHYFWGAKECLYKAYGRKKVEFKSELLVEAPIITEGIFSSEGYVLKENFPKIFNLKGRIIMEDYLLVTAIETKE